MRRLGSLRGSPPSLHTPPPANHSKNVPIRARAQEAAEPADPEQQDALDALGRGFGPVETLEVRPRPAYRDWQLDDDLGDFHTAIDKLNADTCWKGDRCDGRHHCRRHKRRSKA
jgi:hypothetical protein